MRKIVYLPTFLAWTCLVTTNWASEADSFTIDLNPQSWTFAPEVQATGDGTALQLASTAKSVWATPARRWPAAQKIELRVEGSADGGNLLAQVEWLNRSGELVTTAEALRISGSQVQTASAALEAPEGASDFGLKFWFEGDPVKARLLKVEILRQPDSAAAVAGVQRVTPANTKLEVDAGLTHDAQDSNWTFRLAAGTPYAGAHLDNRIEAKAGLRILLPVLELPPGSAVTMQILRWNPAGKFLGESDAFKDLTEAGDYEFVLPAELLGTAESPILISTKIWVTAPAGQAVKLGAIRYTESAANP